MNTLTDRQMKPIFDLMRGPTEMKAIEMFHVNEEAIVRFTRSNLEGIET